MFGSICGPARLCSFGNVALLKKESERGMRVIKVHYVHMCEFLYGVYVYRVCIYTVFRAQTRGYLDNNEKTDSLLATPNIAKDQNKGTETDL